MGLFDVLLGIAEIADALSDKNTYFKVDCRTLEVFKIGTTWKGTARIHGAGEHLETKKVNYSTEIAMPSENSSHSTKRDILRKNLLNWISETFAKGVNLPKEVIVLNDTENCLSCEGFARKEGELYTLTTNSSEAQYYVAYKIDISKEKATLGHEELGYYFMEQTTARITSVDVRDRF